MVYCDECDAVIEDGEEAFVFSDEHDTFYFCCEVCAANFLCVVEEVDYDEEEDDEDFDEDDLEIDLDIF